MQSPKARRSDDNPCYWQILLTDPQSWHSSRQLDDPALAGHWPLKHCGFATQTCRLRVFGTTAAGAVGAGAGVGATVCRLGVCGADRTIRCCDARQAESSASDTSSRASRRTSFVACPRTATPRCRSKPATGARRSSITTGSYSASTPRAVPICPRWRRAAATMR